jgi:hypothetical protein
MTRKEAHTPNSTFAIGGVSFSADSLVVAESSVLRIKFSGKKPAHRKSANRWALYICNLKIEMKNEKILLSKLPKENSI